MASLGARSLSRRWRLLVTDASRGSLNMALDEALSESVGSGGLPFLRFYTWNPSTLSLGRFQNLTAGLTPFALTLPRVRRSTGGGAIWHSNELTYSLGCMQSDIGNLGVKASFETLCQFLIQTWRSQGWEATFAKDRQGETARLGLYSPACFAGVEEYDICVDGKKLGGNAQRRDRLQVFQHGSIPFSLDRSVLDQVFLPGFVPDATATTDLLDLGWTGNPENLADRLAQQFELTLGVELLVDEPRAEELEKAEELEETKYGAKDWTENGGGALRA